MLYTQRNSTEEKLGQIAGKIERSIAAFCQCPYHQEYLLNATLRCADASQRCTVFEVHIIGTLNATASAIVKHLCSEGIVTCIDTTEDVCHTTGPQVDYKRIIIIAVGPVVVFLVCLIAVGIGLSLLCSRKRRKLIRLNSFR